MRFWLAFFAPRLIILAALSLQSNMFPPFDSNPCHMIQTSSHIWLHRPVLGPPEPGIAAHRPVPSRTAFRRWTRAWSCGGANVVRFVLNCPFPFGYPCCRLGSRRLRSKHPFSFWVSLQPMRFELHWLRLVGTLFYLRKYVCRYVRTS